MLTTATWPPRREDRLGLLQERRSLRHGTTVGSRRSEAGLISTPAVDRDLAGRDWASRQGRPPLMIRCYVDNRRSDGGRRPQRRRRSRLVAGAVGRVAGSGRGSVWPGGSAAAGQGVRAWPAGRPATQELLDDRRARRRCQA